MMNVIGFTLGENVIYYDHSSLFQSGHYYVELNIQKKKKKQTRNAQFHLKSAHFYVLK